MKGIKLWLLIAAGCLVAGSLHADIYEWTDENGIKHFTNYAPPDHATILIKSEELPYDEAADRARLEAERQSQLEFARLELAEREAELERREAEAERRAAEAERYAAERERAAEQYLDDARNDRYFYQGGGYYGYYRPPHSRRWYYRNQTASIYFVDPPSTGHYSRKYRVKSYYRSSGDRFGGQHQPPKLAHPLKYQSPHRPGSSNRSAQGAYRVNARSRGQIGRSHSRVGTNGLRR